MQAHVHRKYLKSIPDIVGSLPVRAMQLYLPNEENIDLFEKLIDEVVAPAGITHLTLCIYYRFQYPRHPEIASDDATSMEIAKRITAVCKKNGIKIVPEIDFPGHQCEPDGKGGRKKNGIIVAYPDMEEPKLPTSDTHSVCVRHPRLRPIMYDMIDDLMEAFETDTIHMGFDEAQCIGNCPRCAGVPNYILFAQLVNDANRYIKSKGGEMWMWGDRMLDASLFPLRDVSYETTINNTADAIKYIDKDIVICDWHYQREAMGQLSPSFWEMKGFKHLATTFRSVDGAEQFIRATHVLAESPRTLGTYLSTWATFDDFIKCMNDGRIESYRKTGVLPDHIDDDTSWYDPKRFAHMAANVFLYMFIRPEVKPENK